MKKLLISAFVLTFLWSCGEETSDLETDSTDIVPELNEEEIIEIETATEEVVDGLEELENEFESASNDIDSLLENI